MKFVKKLSIFVILSLVLCMAFSIVAFASDGETTAVTEAGENSGKLDMVMKPDMGMKPESFGDRVAIALQGTVTGMVMVFAVLGFLAVIMTLSKVIFYDIPNKKKEEKKAPVAAPAAPAAPAPVAVPETPAAPAATDDGELAAVITAAIAAMIESGDYKNEFVGGFRVVSFKRSANSAWNRK